MNQKSQTPSTFILLSDQHETLASAVLVEQHRQHKVLRLTSPPRGDLFHHPYINVLSHGTEPSLSWRGEVTQVRGDLLYFEATEKADPQLRRLFRIPLVFHSSITPLSPPGARLPISSKDISCGGIALYASAPLQKGDVYEIIIPFTEPPLLLVMQVLRPISEPQHLYACEFVDLLPQEEALLQEKIFDFSLQRSHH